MPKLHPVEGGGAWEDWTRGDKAGGVGGREGSSGKAGGILRASRACVNAGGRREHTNPGAGVWYKYCTLYFKSSGVTPQKGTAPFIPCHQIEGSELRVSSFRSPLHPSLLPPPARFRMGSECRVQSSRQCPNSVCRVQSSGLRVQPPTPPLPPRMPPPPESASDTLAHKQGNFTLNELKDLKHKNGQRQGQNLTYLTYLTLTARPDSGHECLMCAQFAR
jgi:hypothetical protein